MEILYKNCILKTEMGNYQSSIVKDNFKLYLYLDKSNFEKLSDEELRVFNFKLRFMSVCVQSISIENIDYQISLNGFYLSGNVEKTPRCRIFFGMTDTRILNGIVEACEFKLRKMCKHAKIFDKAISEKDNISIKEYKNYFQVRINNTKNHTRKYLMSIVQKCRILLTLLTGHCFFEDDLIFIINGVPCKDIYISRMQSHNFGNLMEKMRVKELEKKNLAELFHAWAYNIHRLDSLSDPHQILENLEVFHNSSIRIPDMWFKQLFSKLEAFCRWYLGETEYNKVLNDEAFDELSKIIKKDITDSNCADDDKVHMKNKINLLRSQDAKKLFKALICELRKQLEYENTQIKIPYLFQPSETDALNNNGTIKSEIQEAVEQAIEMAFLDD